MGRKKIEKDWNELIVEPFAEPNPQPLAAGPSFLTPGYQYNGTMSIFTIMLCIETRPLER